MHNSKNKEQAIIIWKIRPIRKFLYEILLLPIILLTCIWIDIPPKEIKLIINRHLIILLEIIFVLTTPLDKSKKPLIKTLPIGVKLKYLIIKAEIKKKNIDVPYINKTVFNEEYTALVK